MKALRPVVFIGSSAGRPIARRIADVIGGFAEPLVWDRVFGPTGGTFPDLIRIIPEVDAAILILTPDDRLSQVRDGQSPEPCPAPRDNIVFELGLFIGALGRERVVFLEPDPPQLVKPTDLEGVNAIRYPLDLDQTGGWEAVKDRLIQWLDNEKFRKDTRAIVSWPMPHADGGSLLHSHRGEARHGLLLLGNTLAQTHAADEADLARWLEADPKRRIGKLFLNPHGPHARGRDRPHLHRGTHAAGLAAYRQALLQPLHSRCIPLIYDGPYRYSLRGLDLAPHTWNSSSEVHVTHSTHHRGIAGGFGHSLPYHRGNRAFESFAGDALDLWKSAFANPPGHGISLAVCWEPGTGGSGEEARSHLTQAVRELVGPSGDFHLNPPSQWHFTLASLRRTGPRWGGPLSLSGDSADNSLPPAFAEYLRLSVDQLRKAFHAAQVNELTPEVTHLELTRTGQLIAFHPELPGPLATAMTRYLATRRAELERLGLDATEGSPFLPKHLDFWPHVSVGMAFTNDSALPEPLTPDGDNRLVQLPQPLRWRSGAFQVVHYAYRTFRRIVGMKNVELGGDDVREPDLIRQLEID